MFSINDPYISVCRYTPGEVGGGGERQANCCPGFFNTTNYGACERKKTHTHTHTHTQGIYQFNASVLGNPAAVTRTLTSKWLVLFLGIYV